MKREGERKGDDEIGREGGRQGKTIKEEGLIEKKNVFIIGRCSKKTKI